MFYKSSKSDLNAGFMILFVQSVLVIAAFSIAPGFMLDSKFLEGGGLYDRLEKLHARTTGTIAVNSAFNCNKYPFLKSSVQDGTLAETPEEINTTRPATLLLQSEKWGMRMFQSSFSRTKDRFLRRKRCEKESHVTFHFVV